MKRGSTKAKREPLAVVVEPFVGLPSRMVRGMKFTHNLWLGEDFKPLRCVVTGIRFGCVYWRRVDSRTKKPEAHFGIDQIARFVKPNPSFQAGGTL